MQQYPTSAHLFTDYTVMKVVSMTIYWGGLDEGVVRHPPHLFGFGKSWYICVKSYRNGIGTTFSSQLQIDDPLLSESYLRPCFPQSLSLIFHPLLHFLACLSCE